MTSPKKYIFVIMPFSQQYQNTYNCAIMPAIKEVGAYCQRLDELIFTENMLEKIYNEINKADLIIADLSTKNANVFYELGYAHALNKKVVLITDDGSDIPFDLKQYQHCIYNRDDLNHLKMTLKKRISFYLNNPDQDQYVIIPYHISLNGKKIIKNQTYKVVHNIHRTQNAFYIDFEVMNEDMFYHEMCKNKVILEIDESIIDKSMMTEILYSENKAVFSMGSLPSLFPQEKVKLSVSIAYKQSNTMEKYLNKSYNAVLKILLPSSVEVIPFIIDLAR